MSMLELCYLVQKNLGENTASSDTQGKSWFEQHTLNSNGTVEVNQMALIQPGQAAKMDDLASQLIEDGWQPLDGGYYRQKAGSAPADGADLEKLLGLVMDWTQAGRVDPDAGRTWRDMLINLVTFGDNLHPAPQRHKGDAWAMTDHRRDKLEPRQLERYRVKAVKRQRDPKLQDQHWK